MRCPNCDTPFPEGSTACSQCGRVAVLCEACGGANPQGARFCNSCGSEIRTSHGDRRQLTVMFCDVVDSTPLSERLDPEDFRDVIRSFQSAAANAIERVGGRVAQYLGDGLLAYFGHPVASEDDAGRAARASLALLEALPGLNAQLSGMLPTPLRIRTGVHTGLVVVAPVGVGSQLETLALGETVHVASRLVGLAEPNTVVTSEATRELLGPAFVLEPLGERSLRGVSLPMPVFRIVGVDDASSKPLSSVSLIGRDRDMEVLSSHLDALRAGRGRAVLVSGEPGIGKSRLVASVIGDLEASGDSWFECRCSPYHSGTPFHPVVASLERRLGLRPEDSPEESRSKLAAAMRGGKLPIEESVELLAALLGLPSATSAGPVRPETVEARRRRTFDVLRAWARAQAHRQPTVLVFEDVHWADPSTLELIGGFIEECQTAPLLVLITFRPTFEPPWESPVIHRHTVEPLTHWQVSSLIDGLLEGRTIRPAVREQLIARTDGVPLFVEEVTHAFISSGAVDSEGEAIPEIPTTLRGLLAARIDRLPAPAAETLHLASALGREFQFDLLSFASASERTEPELRRDLTALRRAGLISRQDDAPVERYAFRHALVQETALDSMIRETRRGCHHRIAGALREHFPALVNEQPELLAHHLTEARELPTAVGYWKRAGEHALLRGAHQEAARHFDRGIELTGDLPDNRDRLRIEVELIEGRGTALFSTLGYSHPLVERTFARAERVCERLGDEAPLRVLYGLWGVHLTRANTQALDRLLPRLQAAAAGGDPISRLTALAAEAIRAFYLGELATARRVSEEATACVRTPEHDAFVEQTGYVGGLYPFGYLMWTLGIQGDYARAFVLREEMRGVAEKLGSPYGIALAGNFSMNLARDVGDVELARRMGDEQIAFTAGQMLPFWEGPARCISGWAAIHSGDPEAGIKEIERGRGILNGVGLRVTLAYYCAPLVEGLLRTGRASEALTEARHLMAFGRSHLSGFYDAEILRLEGACLAALGEPDAAAQRYERALALAERQGARAWALRAATDLARLLRGRGERSRASEVLEAAVAPFSDAPADGPATADLGAARRLRSDL